MVNYIFGMSYAHILDG